MHLYDEPTAVQCPECSRWWRPGSEACAVVHLGKGCCHYGDKEVPAPESAPLAVGPGECPHGFPATVRCHVCAPVLADVVRP